ncbi:hypothetical protein ACFLTA_07910 [Bacteroidota bacterium]
MEIVERYVYLEVVTASLENPPAQKSSERKIVNCIKFSTKSENHEKSKEQTYK